MNTQRERPSTETSAPGASGCSLGAAARPYLERITAEGRYPHFIEWANAPGRFQPPPNSFEQVLEWLLDGLTRLADDRA